MSDSEGCIFCRIVAGELPAEIVREDELTVAFMDINPATRGHALVVTRAHHADLLELPERELHAAACAAQELGRRARALLNADGVNILSSIGAAAWQTVAHFHIHVIPRYKDDPLRLPWLPEAGDAEQIARAARALRAQDGRFAAQMCSERR
ncbi:MAG TPA: HIT family protein [Solirubrobacteraceae bacterium]|nr:HIT family protein [Solirubrobacteraceae bacterium]